jgi:hypothetical protein
MCIDDGGFLIVESTQHVESEFLADMPVSGVRDVLHPGLLANRRIPLT